MTDDAVWERVLSLMPTCRCGVQLQPGAAGGQHVLVCGGCSTVQAADPAWVARVVDQARREVDGGQ